MKTANTRLLSKMVDSFSLCFAFFFWGSSLIYHAHAQCVKSIAAGGDHSLALMHDGSVWAWGRNDDTQLGSGLVGLMLLPFITSDKGKSLAGSLRGFGHSFLIKNDGTLWGCGSNLYGQIGLGWSSKTIIEFTKAGNSNDWKQVDCGAEHTLAIKTDGTLWGWGNSEGKVGLGESKYLRPTLIGNDADWEFVSAGSWHSLALKKDGTLWTWGYNRWGQLGDGTLVDKYYPVKVGNANDWKKAAAGLYHSLAIKKDGSLWAWGNNGNGRLGDGSTQDKYAPTRIGYDFDWVEVSVGAEFSTAMKSDGSLWAWGNNFTGQLGDGTNVDKNVPTRMDNALDWASVSAGGDHCLAIKKNGSLWAWGSNYYGQIGNGSRTSSNKPVRIALLRIEKEIDVCKQYTSQKGITYTSDAIIIDSVIDSYNCLNIITTKVFVKKKYNYSMLNKIACDFYKSPSGKIYTQPGIYEDTIINPKFCDSIVVLNLSFNKKTESKDTLNIVACDQYLTPKSMKRYTSSGFYKDTIRNKLGCDSIINFNLTISKKGANQYYKIISCGVYLLGKDSIRSSGRFLRKYLTKSGCDSAVLYDIYVFKKSYASINVVQCNSYVSPSGKKTFTVSGTYIDTLVNKAGCDSILTINLTVFGTSNILIVKNACQKYAVPSGKRVLTVSGVYKDTLVNKVGCDSILTIDLTVSKPSNASIVENVCQSYTVPSGRRVLAVSGIYKDTLVSRAGCDSIISINLTVQKGHRATQNVISCDAYRVPSGKRVLTTSGTYSDTLYNKVGCDSIITIDLKIQNYTSSKITVTSCKGYKTPSGKRIDNFGGIYKDTLKNSKGCDSIITIQLIMLNNVSASQNIKVCKGMTSASGKYYWNKTGTYLDTVKSSTNCDSIIVTRLRVLELAPVVQTLSVCNEYVLPSGKHVFISGMYYDTLKNSLGCDSILAFDLSIDSLDKRLNKDQNQLIALAKNATYQWFDCNKNKVIDKEMNQSFLPDSSGSYAVQITQKGCKTYMSSCYFVDINEENYCNEVDLFPNPGYGIYKIGLSCSYVDVELEIIDLAGRLVYRNEYQKVKDIDLNLDYASGIYLAKLNFGNHQSVLKLLHLSDTQH